MVVEERKIEILSDLDGDLEDTIATLKGFLADGWVRISLSNDWYELRRYRPENKEEARVRLDREAKNLEIRKAHYEKLKEEFG